MHQGRTNRCLSRLLDGLLSLDTYPSSLLNFWPSDGLFGQVTLKQLLSFTSGFLYANRTQLACPADASGNFNVTHCAKDIFDRYSRFPKEPGTIFGYSNEHLELASALVESVTGRLWTEVFNERVVDKLGLSPQTGFPFFSTAGGLEISARDYIKFMTGCLMKSQADCLQEETLEAMNVDYTAEVPEVEFSRTFPGWFPLWPNWHYGLAHWIECPESYPFWSESCTNSSQTGVHSSIGALGFYPIIDFRRREGLDGPIYIVIAPKPEGDRLMEKSLALSNDLRRAFDKAFPLI
uniref:Beta-lactamase-related domain-containing protein n=1 Tax=Tetraselmis sp. GSL018 TaxID=582737 RepID=A0A061SFZ2_9CHLO|eukprot:CAMPEP_0177584570 /NCGR_PEP_ID=MMETSP0419_2-20121207/3973_1 /TAXON_ID=582737 /ORGANISM="Tetraselmis sp., Strain GSL018" /LENGTH=292 /DNA_ID=CAMNT_0019074131 /DNA_START=85 /DNA_END=963 /DNA_ORIENTATION=-